MGQAQHCEQAPRVRILAARSPVVSKGQDNVHELLFAHVFPVEPHTTAYNLLRWFRQLIKEKPGNYAIVTATRTPTGAKQIRLLVAVNAPHLDFARLVYRGDL